VIVLRFRSLSQIFTHIAILGFFTSPVFAGSFTVFGLETFPRDSGTPFTITKSFSVFNTNVPFTLEIYNGGLVDGEFEKVSSSVIGINGLQIVGPDEFNQNVPEVEKPVTLSTDNTISVEVRGKPGGAITIEIIGVDNDPPTIMASASPSPNAAGWYQTDVTVSFSCSDETSGVSGCPDPVTVSTEGVNQLINGTAIDNAGNSAFASVGLNIDKTPPILNVISPAMGSTLNTSKPEISVEFSDVLSGINLSTVNLYLDGMDVTMDASFTPSGLTYTPIIALQDGTHTIQVSASDNAGNTGETSNTLTTKSKTRPFIFPEPGFDSGSYKGSVGISSGPIKVGDINRDGISDVVVVNHIVASFINKISVILGKGDGSFQNPITIDETYNGSYDYIAMDDFNGDGSPDLALTVIRPNREYEVVLFTGNGDGTFTIGTSFTINATGRILTGRFDSDPYDDFAIAAQSGSVILFHGNVNGSFSTPTVAWSGAAGSMITDAVSSDFNRDGLADLGLIVGDSSGGHEVLVLLNNGGGTFQPSNVNPWVDSYYYSNITSGDLNGDGYADILMLRDGQYYLRPDVITFMNDGNGNFQNSHIYSPRLVIPTYNFSISGGRVARLSDVDGDERLDLLISYLDTVLSFPGKGDGTFQPPTEWSVSGSSLEIGDLDQDGAQDLVTVGLDHIFALFGRGDGGFIDREEIPTNSGNYDLVSADLDGDRSADLAIPGVNFGSLFSTVLNNGNTWLENSISPPFQADRTYRAGIGPVFVKTGDLNKDGHPDLVVANEFSNDVSVLLNSGAGDLNAPVSYPVGSAPVFMALEDLDKDGLLDIVTANSGSNNISVLLSNGIGTFQGQQNYSVGPNPKSLGIADINGDGRLDIVVADYDLSVNYVSILLGNGDGTFQSSTPWTTIGWSPVSIQKGDFNADGVADIAVVNYTLFHSGGIHQSLVTLLLGKGDGTFDERIVYQPGDANFLNEISSEDLNRDGKQDLIAIDYHAFTAFVFLNNGYGQFSLIQTLHGLDGSSVTLRDLNQDGNIDLLAGGASSLHPWLGQGDGTFLSSQSIGGWEDVSSMQIGDMNGDGVPDIVLVDGNNLSIIPGEGRGTFPGESVIHAESSDSSFTFIASGDLNSDHNQDIVVNDKELTGPNAGFTKATVYWGNGNNTYERGPTLHASSTISRGVFAEDFNQDGLVDIAICTGYGVLMFLNNGDETFRDALSYTMNANLAGIRIADINNDNRFDIISVEWTANGLGGSSYHISIHAGNGDGTFQPTGTIALDPLEPSDVAVQDFDGDGYPDLAVGMNLGNTLRVYLNNGNGIFSNPITSEVGIQQGNLTAQDFNHDGFMDLVIRDIESVYLLLGNGDGTFLPSFAYGLGEVGLGSLGGMVSRDFNLDGRMDMAASSGHASVNNVKILLNLLPPLHTPPSPPKNLTSTAGDGSVALNWAASPEDNFAGYNLFRSLSSGGGYEKINSTLITSHSYTDSPVTNGQIYYYALTAINTSGDESSLSKKIQITPHPADTTHPVIIISTPLNGGIAVSPDLFVSGTIDDVEATVTVNGISAAVQTQSGTFTAYNIPLNAGLNTITVEAVDPSGNRSSDSVEVTYSLPAGMNGVIQDASSGYPVQGAVVSIQDADGSQTMTTGPDGLYSFIRLVPGEATLTVTPSTNIYQPVTLVKALLPGQIMTVDISLDLRPATLTGTVYDSYPLVDNPKPWLRVYNPIDGALVSVTDGVKSQTVVTDSDGKYQVENITPYEITVSISMTGYEPFIQDQFIGPGQTEGIDYYLDKLPPAAPTGLVATPVIRGVELEWNSNTESDIKGYYVYRATTSGGDYSLLNASLVTSPSYNDAGLTGGMTYYYVVTAVNTSDRESYISAEAVATTPLPTLPISITYPTDGADINASSVIVTGTIDGTLNEIGVLIEVSGPNGLGSVPANVNGNSFAVRIPLQAGSNIITAVARDPAVSYGEASITVNVSIPTEEVILSANPSSGVLDATTGIMAVTLRVEANLANSVSQYQWDWDGDGAIDQVGATLTKISAQYQTMGIFHPAVTVIDDQGNAFSTTTVVNVMSRVELDALLMSKWEGMKAALLSGDSEGALSFYLENSRERYRGLFAALSSHLQEIVTTMQPIELIYMNNGLAKYRIRRAEEAGLITYYIHFQMDDYGIWRIKQF
jgi:fibronectin type 3 domain-containing protein